MPAFGMFDIGIPKLDASPVLNFIDSIIVLKGIVAGEIIILCILCPPNQPSTLIFCACKRLHFDRADRKSLIQGFLAAEVLNAVKDSFVPISGDMKARSTTVPHRGGRLDGELGANWFSGASCSLGRG
jgi:hypothetical protein